jgi:hypothetical protein
MLLPRSVSQNSDATFAPVLPTTLIANLLATADVFCMATDTIFLLAHVLLWVCVNDADNNPFRKLLIRKKALSILRTR